MPSVIAIILVAVSFATQARCQCEDVNAKVGSAIIEGDCITVEGSSAIAFRSVRYAEPPGRFKKSELKSYTVNETIPKQAEDPPRCFQRTDDPISEDCLFMNIYRPGSGGSYPVFVIIHGGGFNTGGIRSEIGTSKGVGIIENLVTSGLVVVVVQYRVGPLGFMTTGDDVMKGNYGLWDLKNALEFIKNNIAAFGGIPDKVTLFGGSAGGAIIDCLSISKETRELYSKSITFAGGVIGDIFQLNMTKNTIDFAATLNKPFSTSAKLLEDLSESSMAADLKAGWFKLKEDSYDVLQLDWAPTMDGEFFIEEPSKLRESAPIKPRIMGVAINEGAGFTTGITEFTEDMLNKVLEKMIKENETERGLLKEKYIKLGQETEPDASMKASFQYALGEHTFVGPAIAVADKLIERNKEQKIYLYVFEHFNLASARGDKNIAQPTEASHAFDQHYFLRNKDGVNTADDITVSKFCGSLAYNFASTSDPNGNLVKDWVPMDAKGSSTHLRIKLAPEMKTDTYFDGRPRTNNAFRTTPVI